MALIVALLHLRLGWDDGAITAAFSRTFHETGRFALTPVSETVEGFSSMLWMLLLACLDNVSHTVEGMLSWSKAISAIAFVLSLLVFARLTRHFVAGALRYLAIFLLAMLITPLREVVNGMEMNLYLLLVLSLAEILLEDDLGPVLRWSAAALLSFALTLTRFEAPGLIFFLYVGIFFTSQRRFGVLLLAFADVLFFGLTEIWRHKTFGVWVPNTVLAKQWPPYAAHGLKLQLVSRAYALSEFLIVLAVPLLMVAILGLAARYAPRRKSLPVEAAAISPLLVSMILGAILLAVVMGRNWGHTGRMHLGFLPFFILSLVAFSGRLLSRTGLVLQPFVLSVIVLQAVVWVAETKTTAFHSVTYASVEPSGLAADELRRILHKETVSVFIPDVGGTALCCEKLNIMDAALLANPTLARQGLAGTAAFLTARHPDVIKTHYFWASLDGLYAPHGLVGYSEVQLRGKTLFLRDDLYESLKQSGYAETLASSGVVPCAPAAEAAAETREDLAFVRAQARCILISH